MIRTIILIAFIVNVAAFVAPSSSRLSSLSMMFNFGGKKAAPAPAPVKGKTVGKTVSKNTVSKKSASSDFAYGLVGSDVEVPNFDPFGLSSGKSEETVQWYRAAELKHARVCMLAALGLSVQPAFHLPDPVFDSTLGYGVLSKLSAERPEALYQIILAIAAVEVFTLFKDGQGVAGDLSFDPLDLQTKLGLKENSEKFSEMQLRELKNGRLAMIGTAALLLQEAVTGYGPYEQLLKH